MVSTYRLSCDGIQLALCASGNGGWERGTHDLVYHNQDTRLRVLHCLQISEDGTAQTRVHARVDVAIEACRLNVELLGHQQEDVSLCGLGDEVEVVEHIALDLLRSWVDDKLRIDIDMR